MSVVHALRLAENGKTVSKHSRSPRQPWQNVTGMEPRTLEYISIACGGELAAPAEQVLARRVCTDSRRVQPGDLFVAIRGDRFDGHDFVEQAAKAGASAVVVEPSLVARELPCPKIVVADTRRALGRLAACYRADFDLPVVAVAGSNGKTTTKEILRTILGESLRMLCSEASFNNDIGVPLTLLQINGGHQAAIVEVGTNHPGELAPLVQMAQPRFGVITSIAREHLEFFEDLAGVAHEEGWLAELLPAYGKLFINGDAPRAAEITKRCRGEVTRVGGVAGNDWRLERIQPTADGTQFQLTTPRSEFSGTYHVPLLGQHQAMNTALALAVGCELGLSADEARRNLAKCQAPAMRLQAWRHEGLLVLDDSYNANADSMLAAIDVLKSAPCAGRRVAVIGDMAEQGKHTAQLHEEVGRHAAHSRIDYLVVVGAHARSTGDAAKSEGLSQVAFAGDVEAALVRLREFLKPGDSVLVKGSRSARLDRITSALRQTNGHS